MSRVDYCVTTMDRPHALERLLISLAEHRPEASVHIADQSGHLDPRFYDGLAGRLERAGLHKRPTVHRLPFDCGVSAARNHLADSTPAEYKLTLDDDFVFTDRTDVDAMVTLLDAHPQAGAVGGNVIRNGQVRNVGSRLKRRGPSLHELAPDSLLDECDGIRFRQVSFVPAFALMRQELHAMVRWDPELKTAGEHFDFFLRVQETPYAVLHAPDVTIDHPPVTVDPAYKQLRWRGEFLKRMMLKHELARMKTIEGVVTELCSDGELIRYCELDRTHR